MAAAAAPNLDRALELLTLRGGGGSSSAVRAGGEAGPSSSAAAATTSVKAGFPRDEVVRLATAEAMRLVRISEVRRGAEPPPPCDSRRLTSSVRG